MLLSGCFTWSDSWATTSKPWNAMKSTPRPRALKPEAAMWPPHDSHPLRKPLGEGNALRTQTYAPPEASGRPDASSAYAMPARAATNAATPRLARTRGPETVYAAPTSRKIAAPTIAPTAVIVTSNRPRSRVTRTRTDAAGGRGPDTRGRSIARLLETMATFQREKAFARPMQ